MLFLLYISMFTQTETKSEAHVAAGQVDDRAKCREI